MVINNINTKVSSSSAIFSTVQAKPVQQTFKSTLDKVTTTGNLDAIFSKATKTYGVSEKLLRAIAQAESGLNPSAVSNSGAQGIMQLMPKTAKALGVTNPLNPEQSIMGGAKYISQMLKRYDGNETLALAAYNAGPGNVKKYGGIPPFKETENYIAKISKIMNGNLSSGTIKTSAIITEPDVKAYATSGYSMSNNSLGLTPNWYEFLDPLKIDEDTASILMNIFVLENL